MLYKVKVSDLLPKPDSYKAEKQTTIPYQRPVEIGCFSYDEDRQLHLDDRSMKMYKEPQKSGTLCLDLNDGYPDRFKAKPSQPEHLIPVFNTLQSLYFDEENNCMKWPNKHSEPPALITWRGIMTKILVLPYCKRDSFKLFLVKRSNTLVMEEVMDERYWKKYHSQEDEKSKRFSYWGHRFESYCCRKADSSIYDHKNDDDNDDDNDNDDIDYEFVVNTMEEYGIVARCKLDKFELILGAEVDCKNPETGSYMELKTARQNSRIPFAKCLKMWAQSFLIGVETLVIGRRDDDGFLRSIETERVSSILRKNGIDSCDLTRLFGFVSNLISLLQKSCEDSKVYLLEYNAETQEITLDSTSSKSASDFIPEKFNLE